MKAQYQFTTRQSYKEYLRYYYAGLAMQGCLSGLTQLTSYNEVYVAEHAIKIANELLTQLEAKDK